MDPGGMLLEDFGQRVDLMRRIREVLANYPEGTTALRELIQNADDAGASRVRLCLDRRAHGASSLLAPAPAQWQGPALLAHNDAAFTDEDFASISRIGDSKKAWKTGRFRALKIKLTERNKDLEVAFLRHDVNKLMLTYASTVLLCMMLIN